MVAANAVPVLKKTNNWGMFSPIWEQFIMISSLQSAIPSFHQSLKPFYAWEDCRQWRAQLTLRKY
jgi:hypothetical protein